MPENCFVKYESKNTHEKWDPESDARLLLYGNHNFFVDTDMSKREPLSLAGHLIIEIAGKNQISRGVHGDEKYISLSNMFHIWEIKTIYYPFSIR